MTGVPREEQERHRDTWGEYHVRTEEKTRVTVQPSGFYKLRNTKDGSQHQNLRERHGTDSSLSLQRERVLVAPWLEPMELWKMKSSLSYFCHSSLRKPVQCPFSWRASWSWGFWVMTISSLWRKSKAKRKRETEMRDGPVGRDFNLLVLFP